MEKIKKLFHSTGTKQGSFSIGMTAVVVAIVVVANLIVGQLPEKYRNIDVSSTKIYEISDTSRELLKNLDDEVTMTVLAEKETADERIQTFISKYSGLSDKISVEWIDPVLHPSALEEYDTSENTIVIACEATGKSTTVAFSDIIVEDYYSYYYTGSASESEFDGEGQLTSAVNYVTTDNSETIYRTTGHGEASFSTTITDLLEKNSYQMEEINLLMESEIPEDCDLLLMYAPTNDLTEDEKNVIDEYLAQGGKVMILLGDTNAADLPNIAAIMQEYGMEPVEGYIADTQRCYQQNPYYIFPELNLSGSLADGMSSQMVLLTNAHGFEVGEAERDTIQTSEFMTTSSYGYAVTEDTQEEGTYTLGAVATEEINSDEETTTATSRLTVISAASLIDSQITDTLTTLENTTLFMNAVAANFDGVQNISIAAKSLAVEYNTIQHAGGFSLLVIIVIPAVLLIGGFVVWYRRRKA